MKGILCLECVDIKALKPVAGQLVVCECMNMCATWTNPSRGWAKVKALNKDTARMIGFHNGFLRLAVDSPEYPKNRASTIDQYWKDETEALLKDSVGYLFSDQKRSSPIVIFRVGETSDVVWWEDYIEPVVSSDNQ